MEEIINRSCSYDFKGKFRDEKLSFLAGLNLCEKNFQKHEASVQLKKSTAILRAEDRADSML